MIKSATVTHKYASFTVLVTQTHLETPNPSTKNLKINLTLYDVVLALRLHEKLYIERVYWEVCESLKILSRTRTRPSGLDWLEIWD